ncbi:MAG: GYD domain-containing protein [Candidatus Hodarchaeales archaeon]|jgi:uncharacterized protein with GYD domain
MPTYVILGNWTQEGLKNIKETGKRIENAKKISESLGGTIKEVYYTFGRYDFVSIAEGVNNESVTKALLTIAGAGTVRTETLIAHPSEEFLKIVAELP